MDIALKRVIPIPLKEKFSRRQSNVWNNDLRLQQGEWIKIQAPSGTGKTTLIHLIYNLRNDYEGNICFAEEDTRMLKDQALATFRQQHLSVIFQDLRLFSRLTARENIELKRVLQPPCCTSERIDEMAGALGISSILGQPAALCSYGEQQRVAIIRALVQPFDWLLMDEPFSHLDKENITLASALIGEECKKRGAGFILTDLDEDDHFNYSRTLFL